MSADPTDLLDRATPDRVPVLDYQRLARTGRRRRRLHRTGAVLATVLVVAGGALTALELRPPASLEVIDDAPEPQPAGDPVGAWSVVAELDDGRNDAFAQTTGTGQLVVYGGTEGLDGPPARDGRVIDLADGSTTTIPAPPIEARPFPRVALADQRLMVFGGNDGRADGAAYDLARGTWTVVPEAPTADVAPTLRYWDGTTLIVGDSYRMSDRTVGNPALWRWQVGQDSWTAVPGSPLDVGDMTTSAGDGRLAVWTDPVVDDPDSGLDRPEQATDAAPGRTRLAVYDVATGTWATIPRQDLPPLPEHGRAAIAWVDDELVVVPMPAMNPFRDGPDDRGEAVALAPPMAYTPDTLAPRPLEALPADLQRDTLEVGVGDGGVALSPERAPLTATVGRIAAALTDDGTWTEPVTASQIRRVGADLVAVDTPWVRDTPLAAAVWDDGWRPAPDPAAPARGFAAITTSDDALVLVGGSSLRTPAPGEPAGGEPSEAGEGGPYVIDTHHTIVRYDPRS